jgi:NTP pyrophosphohydrolases including oxidative damage repair enzymes
MVYEVSSGIIIFRRLNEIQFLFLMKIDGYLDFTKGHVEKGENKITAAIRETEEESGIRCEIIEGFEEKTDYYFYRNKNIHKEVTLFLGEVDPKTKVRTSKEHDAYVWLNFEDAMTYLRHENQKRIIRRAMEFINERNNAESMPASQ